MKQNGRVNALLVELLIVVLMFMLASTTLMEIFGAAKENSTRAAARSEALLQTQNMAEALYACDDMPSTLDEMGFARQEVGWVMDCGTYTLIAQYTSEKTDAGVLNQTTLTADCGGEALFTLPAVKYVPGEVQP